MTLKELSAACGLSVSTVSKALNGYVDVNEETRRMVCEKAAQLGYKPNVAARGLRSGRTQTLGVLYNDDSDSGLTHNYFSPILQAFRKKAEERGYDITFISTRNGSIASNADDFSLLEHCRSRNFDGICAVCCHFDNPKIQELLKSDIPLVTIDYLYQGRGCIRSDNVQGMELLMKNVLSMGHTRIGFVYGSEASVATARLKCFRKAMLDAGLNIPEGYIIEGDYHNPATTRRVVRKMLDLPQPPTCILMPDDYAAIGGIDAIREKGLTVPDDVSVVGFDGVPLLQRVRPSLTTIRQDTQSIGTAAAKQLIALIEQPEVTNPDIVVIPCSYLPGQTLSTPPESGNET